MAVSLVNETVFSNPTNLGHTTFSLSAPAAPGNVLVMVSMAFLGSPSWLYTISGPSYNYVSTDVDSYTGMNQVPYFLLGDPPESGTCGNTGTPGHYNIAIPDDWCWASFDPGGGLGGASITGTDILYWVTAGATQISFISSASPKIWVYELSGFSGLPAVDDYNMSLGGNASHHATVLSSPLAGTGASDFCLTIAVTANISYTAANVPSPWTLDSTVIAGNAPAYILNGSGTQASFNYGHGSDSFTSASVAFKSPATFCGGMPSQAVGNPLKTGKGNPIY